MEPVFKLGFKHGAIASGAAPNRQKTSASDGMGEVSTTSHDVGRIRQSLVATDRYNQHSYTSDELLDRTGYRCRIAWGNQFVQNPPLIGTAVVSACQV